MQGTGLPHVPPEHDCRALPEHCVAPGLQEPAQYANGPLPASDVVHTPLVQFDAVPQVPVALQVCTPLPMHCVEPGEQSPEHTPDRQTWLLHGVALPHCPPEVHVWTPPLAEHWVLPGAQIPVQPPDTQAWLPQSCAAPH